jgi:hypothetical protein
MTRRKRAASLWFRLNLGVGGNASGAISRFEKTRRDGHVAFEKSREKDYVEKFFE